MHRHFLLGFLVEFTERFKKLATAEQQEVVSDPLAFKTFVFSIKAQAARTQQHALLHLVHPDTFESMSSENHKKLVVDRFRDLHASDETDLDRCLLQIRKRLSETYGDDFTFYQKAIRHEWKPPEEETIEREAWRVRESRSDLCREMFSAMRKNHATARRPLALPSPPHPRVTVPARVPGRMSGRPSEQRVHDSFLRGRSRH